MNLVTGATGLLGSHIVEQLRKRGRPVRALVRRDSDRAWLQSQGVEFAEGDITDRASMVRAAAGCDVVYHAAAKVGDWGPWADFQRITIDGTENVAHACEVNRVRRMIHISSISVFGYYTREQTIDETFPTGYKLYEWAYYSRSKWIAENNVMAAHKAGRIRATVIRPAWIYGPRDRATIARLVSIVEKRQGRILGKGDNRLNLVYAGNVAEGCILAADREDVAGEVFNCSNDGDITQQQYFDMLAHSLGAKPVTVHAPYGAAYFVGFLSEVWGRLTGSPTPPRITRYAIWLMGRRSFFSAEKARRVLGWKPTVTYDVGIPMTVNWYLTQVGRATPSGSGVAAAAAR